METLIGVLAAAVSVSTLLGLASNLSSVARARKNAERTAEFLGSTPPNLIPLSKRIHWDSSAHLLALELSRRAYPGTVMPWFAVSIVPLVTTCVVAMYEIYESPNPRAAYSTIITLGLAAAFLIFMGIVRMASRRRFYLHAYDRMISGERLDSEELRKASSSAFRPRLAPLSALAASGIVMTSIGVSTRIGLIYADGSPGGELGGLNLGTMWTAFGAAAGGLSIIWLFVRQGYARQKSFELD